MADIFWKPSGLSTAVSMAQSALVWVAVMLPIFSPLR